MPIRLSAERWQHIVTRHPELRGFRRQLSAVIRAPEFVVAGSSGEHVAVRRETDSHHWLVVIYREKRPIGFVITAYRARRVTHLLTRPLVWHRERL